MVKDVTCSMKGKLLREDVSVQYKKELTDK